MTPAGVVRAATRPLRRVRRVVATSDPDQARLRLAVTTISTLIIVAVVLVVGASFAGQVVTTVIPGIILAMIASMAVRESRPGPRAATIALLVPASVASISLASVFSGTPVVADAVFVAVAVAGVFLRALGERGTAAGMVAFMSYFLAVFVRIAPAQLPVIVAAAVVSGGLTIVIRQAFHPRHPDRDVRRMISALGDRAGRVADALAEAVDDGALDERLRRSTRSRLASSSSTAGSVEEVLENADAPVVEGISNDELGVRVFDFQLTLEHLAETVDRFLAKGEGAEAERAKGAAKLRRFASEVRGPVQLGRSVAAAANSAVGGSSAGSVSELDPDALPLEAAPSVRLAQLDRILDFGLDAWVSVASRGPDATSGGIPDPEPLSTTPPDDANNNAATSLAGDGADASEDRRRVLRDVSRQAVQVGVAASLAIAAGTAISSTRWFWAVIAAFVVYVGTSSRGEILTKGWLRVVGTLGGVVVGVLVAALVGGNTILALVLIAVSMFLGFYLMSISSAFMIFFITTMLALLYGLLGEFSIGLLLTRLTETAAGAAIGVGVAYVVLPTSTRDVARDRMREFLEALAAAVTSSSSRIVALDASRTGALAPSAGRELRSAFDALSVAVKPLTQGWAGVSDRGGSRRTMQILVASEHHGRALLRLADGAPAIARSAVLRELVDTSAAAVRANIETLSGALGGRIRDITMRPAAALFDELEDAPDVAASPHRAELVAAFRNLRAIDQAICSRAGELGAALDPLLPGVLSLPSHATATGARDVRSSAVSDESAK